MNKIRIFGYFGIFVILIGGAGFIFVFQDSASQIQSTKSKNEDLVEILNRKRRAAPGALVCAAVGFANNPIGGLGLCGGYQNKNLTESSIATPDQYCNSQCTGAVCKDQAYCLCPAGVSPLPFEQEPASGDFVGCFPVAGTNPETAASVIACRNSCQNREGKSPYLCATTVPKQLKVEYCMCADPNYPPPPGRRKRETVAEEMRMREESPHPHRRTRRDLLNGLLGGLIQTVLNILQTLLEILGPVTGLVCKVLVSVDDQTARVPTCFNFPGTSTSTTCDPANPQNPVCQCRKFCGSADRVCCSTQGTCICRDAPVSGCGPATTGTASLICKGLCSAGQTPYTCLDGYCVCHDPDPLNLGLGFQSCAVE